MARSSQEHKDPNGSASGGTAADSRPVQGYRETVEAVAIAFIIALLARGLEAEAFVIPTGSMAPTLMGRHKEVHCPQCGYTFTVNASEEVEGVPADQFAQHRVAAGVCVNCRYLVRLADEPSFKGDRILVMKFPYDLPFLPGAGGPHRWDVVVFRYPEEPEVSYIKRLVGLPGETVRIWYGDVFIKPPGGADFRQERRPLGHQSAMQMMVYDDRHRPSLLKDRPEWRRWSGAGEGWPEDSLRPGRFVASGDAAGWSDLKYRHLVPDPEQWKALEAGQALPRPARPTLVTDFYAYNTNLTLGRSGLSGDGGFDQGESAWMQPHWVGDLTLSARVESESAEGSIRFELVEGGVINRCEVRLDTGEARISHGGIDLGSAATPLKGTGSHEVMFANVDNRLTLWVDGRPVFGEGRVYEEGETHPEPTDEDLAPARVAAKGARVAVSDLVLRRDIYYTQYPGSVDYGNAWSARLPRTPAQLFDLLAEPRRVAALGPLGWSDYPLGEDRFLMMGDNSPRSKDSRGWSNKDLDWDATGRQRWEVPRTMITGKAFCVYWPHGKPFGPDFRVGQDFRVPFRPYFERMSLIR